MKKRELTIVVKGANLPNGEQSRSRQFSDLLRRGELVRDDASFSTTHLLFQLFGLTRQANTDYPIAAVTRVLDLGVVDSSWWIRADPVHLAAGLSGLTLVANRGLNLPVSEAEQMAEEIRIQYKEEGWLLKAPNPYRWYLKPKQPADITTYPLDQVLGRDVDHYLPEGPEARQWHTLLNETQILLHTSAINAAREARGELSVNSLWFWGGGCLPQLTSSRWSTVWSDDVVSLALARLSETEFGKLPQDPTRWLQTLEPGSHLLVIDQQEQEIVEDHLEQNWATPLFLALKKGDIDWLRIYLSPGLSATLTGSNIRSIWSWLLPFGRA
jgi:hypothetical protein